MPATMEAIPYHEAFTATRPFGQLAAVHLPPGLEPVPAEVLARLAPAERDHAATLRGRRQIEWTGGRLALRLAAQAAGIELPPVLPGPRGEPLLPEAVSASISHKRTIALALVGRGPATLGLDAEELEPPRLSILPRVLGPAERSEVEALPESARWSELVTRFAVKEAIYKALHPHVYRYVKFEEAQVGPLTPGESQVPVELHLAQGEGPFDLRALFHLRGPLLVAEVSVAKAGPPPHN